MHRSGDPSSRSTQKRTARSSGSPPPSRPRTTPCVKSIVWWWRWIAYASCAGSADQRTMDGGAPRVKKNNQQPPPTQPCPSYVRRDEPLPVHLHLPEGRHERVRGQGVGHRRLQQPRHEQQQQGEQQRPPRSCARRGAASYSVHSLRVGRQAHRHARPRPVLSCRCVVCVAYVSV